MPHQYTSSIQREQAKLFLIGKQSIDGDNCQTGQMLAGLLGRSYLLDYLTNPPFIPPSPDHAHAGWSQCTFASKVDVDGEKAMVER
jgi:electron transfer flavoprotein beta subunit